MVKGDTSVSLKGRSISKNEPERGLPGWVKSQVFYTPLSGGPTRFPVQHVFSLQFHNSC